ncbi:hypothetical protein CerSpe_170330 [Prunus speciosa]
MDQHKTDDNLRYVGGLTHVLAADASISFVDLRCQLPDEGFQNTDAGGDCEKNEDEDDFSSVQCFPIFNQDLLFADSDYDHTSRARGAAASSSSLRSPLKKLFFEELDAPTSATSFYNSGGELGS